MSLSASVTNGPPYTFAREIDTKGSNRFCESLMPRIRLREIESDFATSISPHHIDFAKMISRDRNRRCERSRTSAARSA